MADSFAAKPSPHRLHLVTKAASLCRRHGMGSAGRLLILTIEEANRRCEGTLPGTLGIEFIELKPGHAANVLEIRPEHLAPNGYLHAASVVALADTCCGVGTLASLPDGADSFTTMELKTNFIGTATEGRIRCVAERVHSGRTTQLWDAKVIDGQQRTLALFRCTQLILYPRKNG